jgi:hypothetical protein
MILDGELFVDGCERMRVRTRFHLFDKAMLSGSRFKEGSCMVIGGYKGMRAVNGGRW